MHYPKLRKEGAVVRRRRLNIPRVVYDSYIMRRTQIYLDDAQADELSRRAAVRGTSTSKMIREAIDQYLAGTDDESAAVARYRGALADAFGAAPHLPDGAQYVDEVRGADRDRERALQERAGL